MVDMLKFKDGSNIWFTSDHHFNDDRIRQFCMTITSMMTEYVSSAADHSGQLQRWTR